MTTLPEACRRRSVNLHCLRSFLRRHGQNLAQRGQKIGQSFVYRPEDVEEIFAAFAQRRTLPAAVVK
jgi:hypothetical protein